MLRGLYTSASGMLAQWNDMNVISNNLANVDQTAFKKDTSIFKSFPEMILRRMNDDGVVKFPLGSYDKAPVVGKLGTGVEVNDVFTDFTAGLSLKSTSNKTHFALEGRGFFALETNEGEKYTRNGSFTIDNQGYLTTKEGFKVLGENGYIRLQNQNMTNDMNNIVVDEMGRVFTKDIYEPDAKYVDTLKIMNFYDERQLEKYGNSYFVETKYSGHPQELNPGDGRPKVIQGFLEGSNVNAIYEMVKMIEVQRTYEANQKALQTHDSLLGRAVNEVGKGI